MIEDVNVGKNESPKLPTCRAIGATVVARLRYYAWGRYDTCIINKTTERPKKEGTNERPAGGRHRSMRRPSVARRTDAHARTDARQATEQNKAPPGRAGRARAWRESMVRSLLLDVRMKVHGFLVSPPPFFLASVRSSRPGRRVDHATGRLTTNERTNHAYDDRRTYVRLNLLPFHSSVVRSVETTSVGTDVRTYASVRASG